MDNYPSQTSCIAKLALDEIEGSIHQIPPRSPDLNSIENIFHLVKRYLDQEAICRNIIRESFDEFNAGVLGTFGNIPPETIDEIISSMNRRITSILSLPRAKGQKINHAIACHLYTIFLMLKQLSVSFPNHNYFD